MCGSLRAAPKHTLDNLIAGVEDGVLIEGRGSYSIDQQRYNFQFGGDAFWEIKGGKKRGHDFARRPIRRARPISGRPAIGVAGPSYWEQYGAYDDAKGEPTQLNAVSHGCSPARFRQIQRNRHGLSHVESRRSTAVDGEDSVVFDVPGMHRVRERGGGMLHAVCK